MIIKSSQKPHTNFSGPKLKQVSQIKPKFSNNTPAFLQFQYTKVVPCEIVWMLMILVWNLMVKYQIGMRSKCDFKALPITLQRVHNPLTSKIRFDFTTV